MSGHSKWSTIKRKKGAADAKRSKIFSRISKEITIAVKEGGGSDVEANARLRLAIQNAKGQNMPKDVMERAISKGDKDGSNLEEMNFEGYGLGGVAIFVECLSDNINRTVGAIRSIFNKNGGSLGTNGSLGFIFERKGVFQIKRTESMDLETLELELIDAGAEHFEEENDYIVIVSALEYFGAVNKKLEALSIESEKSELQRIPTLYKSLSIDESKRVLKMLDDFEENDDVQNVFHNLEITEELLRALNDA